MSSRTLLALLFLLLALPAGAQTVQEPAPSPAVETPEPVRPVIPAGDVVTLEAKDAPVAKWSAVHVGRLSPSGPGWLAPVRGLVAVRPGDVGSVGIALDDEGDLSVGGVDAPTVPLTDLAKKGLDARRRDL
jgi:hypothetical protein